MQHIHVERSGPTRDVTLRADIAEADVTTHRNAAEAEREMRPEACESLLRAISTCGRVGYDPDLVTARRLSARQVEHMAEQSAHGRPQDVQDPEGSVGPGHED
jgi:hypothetical protein